MATSLNTQALLAVKGECFNMADPYGNLLLGNKAFEFYSSRNKERNLQIPWEQIQQVQAVVYQKKYFGRYVIVLKSGETFQFASKDTKKVLQIIARFIGPENVVHARTLADKVKGVFKRQAK